MIRKILLIAVASLVACSNAETTPDDVATISETTQSDRLGQAHSQDIGHLSGIQPRKTRSGQLRFTSSDLRGPAAAEVLLEKAQDASLSDEARAAAVEAITRTGANRFEDLIGMLESEASQEVRVSLVAALQRAPKSGALAGLRLGLADREARVRAEAARVAGRHPQGAALSAELIAATADSNPQSRAAAARSLGILGISEASGALSSALSDVDADVRLESLRALERLGKTSDIGLTRLAEDSDPRVARVAQRLSAKLR
jgi:HEAT repeat protein